ncbi:MAG: AraC family transcriptional regulator [Thermoanaerobaculales bacterium]|jgi:AraC-like DNA-binding protein|nr:AraC family transcriptional regulator [Thermoanaerobaculales bacterium]
MVTTTDLSSIVASSGYVEQLFDRVPDVVFFVKDLDSRYRVVNTTLVERCGMREKSDLIGRTTAEVFPSSLGTRYLEQDRWVIRSGEPLNQRLELHLYPNRHEGWCLTDKVPLMDARGSVVGVAGISRDLDVPDRSADADDLFRAVELIRSDPLDDLAVDEIARRVGLSAYQLNRRLKDLLGITARQLLTKSRIDTASRLLRTTPLAISDVAQQSGYCDQSAFTRQFRKSTGLTPREYRQRHRES